jgi:hypothetical protein
MNTSKLRAPSLLAAVSIVLVGVVAHAGVPVGRSLPRGPVKVGPISVGPNNAPPPVLGWPHARSSAVGTPCHAAGPNEVVITVPNGACLSLAPGFYVTLNDVTHTWLVSQISVGSAVRARSFFLENFSQQMDHAFIMYQPGTNVLPTDDAQTIRSMRVEPAARSMVCNDLRAGEIALFEGWDGAGDCVVLPVGQYASTDEMGIANDSISGVNNKTNVNAILFWNASFNKQGAVINPGVYLPRLPQGGHFSDTIDNQTSSMQML